MNNNRKERATKTLILYTLTQITELYPPMRMMQHLSFILDKADSDSYHWSDERLLHEIERYKDRLEAEYDDLEDESING